MSTHKDSKRNGRQQRAFRLQRRDQVAKYYLKGLTQLEISQKLECSLKTIANDLRVVREAWLQSSLQNFDEKKSLELARLDELEAVAWQAWQKSTQDTVTKYTKTELMRKPVGTRAGGHKKAAHQMTPIKVVENESLRSNSGDPRFLEQIGRCIEMRLKVIGAFKDVGNTGNVVVINWGDLAKDMRDQPDEEDEVEKLINADLPRLGSKGEIIDTEEVERDEPTNTGIMKEEDYSEV